MVGCMRLGAVLLVGAMRTLLAGRGGHSVDRRGGIVAGLVVWAFGVLQKETSICVLLLAPFLLPILRAQRPHWARLDRGRRTGIVLTSAGGVCCRSSRWSAGRSSCRSPTSGSTARSRRRRASPSGSRPAGPGGGDPPLALPHRDPVAAVVCSR